MILSFLYSRHGFSSIPELELLGNSNSGIVYLKKIGIDKFGIGIEACYKN